MNAVVAIHLRAQDTLPAIPYYLSKTEFLQQYGKDDSSRALIRFYFRKRTKALKMIIIPWSIGTAVGTSIGIIAFYTISSSALADFLQKDIFLKIFPIVNYSENLKKANRVFAVSGHTIHCQIKT